MAEDCQGKPVFSGVFRIPEIKKAPVSVLFF
jgi:hypothetical protein